MSCGEPDGEFWTGFTVSRAAIHDRCAEKIADCGTAKTLEVLKGVSGGTSTMFEIVGIAHQLATRSKVLNRSRAGERKQLNISQLAWPGMLIEIDVTAMVPLK
ncbi:MAG: hypothetical protein WBQ55_19640 [Xanthobacteraceae bacterium]